ncbi:MAG: phosphatase PAP2 family protein [Prevotellaceae bacterium]|jgi:hypothetical protein|nr:phosphatase PAP2 family protein [Prevotellaceae bacterium]
MLNKYKPLFRFVMALLPFFVFAGIYDCMRWFPNYLFNPIDTRGLYETEKALFGICSDGQLLTLCEYFAAHHSPFLDLISGLFYLTWIPVPIGFALYLYFKGEKRLYFHFAWTFLVVNLIGFAGYYLHPAAPPWYVLEHGFDPILSTTGNVAGLGRFDKLVGLPIFAMLYQHNSNVFAALPSLHAAYMPVAFAFALMRRTHPALLATLFVLMVGIWWTAVYSCHHYVIDVLLGIAAAVLGVAIDIVVRRITKSKVATSA